MAKNELILGYTKIEFEKNLDKSFNNPFVIYEDLKDEMYRFFIDDAKAEAWFTERDKAREEGRAMDAKIEAYQFPGTGIVGTPNFTATVEFLHGDGERAPEGSTGNYISIRPKIEDRSKNDTHESISVYVNISNNGDARPTIYDIVRSNEVYTINIDDYLRLGDNDIVITIEGRASGARKTVVMSYNIFRLAVDCGFNFSQPLPHNKNFSVNYTVKGNGQKDVYFYIDGVVVANHTISANDSEASLSQTIVNSGDKALSPGKHTLQIYAVSNGYSSDLLYYEFIVEGIENIFTTTLISYRFAAGTPPFSGSVPGFTGTQYITKILDWAYYSNDPSQRNPKITWRLYANGIETHLATRTADVLEAESGKLPNPLEFMPSDFGKYRLQAIIEGYNYIMPNAHKESVGDDHDDPKGLIACYSIEVAKNEQVQEAVDGITVKLSGLGRSNDEPVEIRNDFSDRGIRAVFHDMPFNNRYGYVNNAVVLGGGSYMTIPLNPFSAEFDVRENGNTLDIDFETFDVKDENTPLFQLGSLDGFHVCIYATRAEIKTSRGIGPEVRFRSNTRYKLTFVTHPDTDLDGKTKRFMELYMDGIRTAVVQYGTTDSLIVSDSEFTVGNPNAMAGFKLYTLRSYSGLLRDYNVLNNYIIDSGQNINALVKRNDIYVEGSRTKVSVDKLKAILPVWELTGPFDRMITAKDKIEFDGYARYTDAEHPDLNIESPITNFKTSGESSLSDNMQKGIHVKFNKNGNQLVNGEGKAVYGNRWSPFVGNALERKIRLNADGLESSHVHNMVIENLINEIFPKVQVGGKYVLRTPAQDYVLSGEYAKDMKNIYGGNVDDYVFPYKINYASDWKPVAVVWRPDDQSEYELYGIFSMGEEKKSDFTHGRRSIYLKKTDDGILDPYDYFVGEKGERGYDNAGTVQFEIVRDSALTFMTDSSAFDTDAKIDCEKVYQDEDDCTDEVNNAEWQLFGNEVIRPVASTYIRTDHDENGIPFCVLDQEAFHNLLFSGKFNIWSFLAARSIIRKCGLTDTYVRNSQWLRLPKQFRNATQWNWWFAYWDLDMAFGLQQPSGALIIPPSSDRTSRIGDSFVFTGKRDTVPESSAFWDGIDEEMEIGKQRIIDAGDDEQAIIAARVENAYYMFTQLEDALDAAGFTVENVLKLAHEMIAKYGEALYNSDGQTKYIDTLSDGANYLPRLQGSRASHLDWWAYESFERWNADTATGPYQTNAVSLNLTANKPESQIKIVAGGHSFFGWGLTSTPIATGVEKNTGDAFAFTIGRSLNGNDPIKIFMPNKIAELDLSDAGDRISGRIELGKFYNEGTGITLRKLNLGVPKEKMAAGTFNNFSGKTWTGLNYLTTLEELNIQGYRFVAAEGTLDLSKIPSLMRLYAAGATGMTALQPADGTNIVDYELPDSIQSLVLNSCTISGKGISWWNDASETTIPESLHVLQMSGMGNDKGAHKIFSDWLKMVANLSDEERLTYRVNYTNINMRDVDIEDIITLANMKLALPSSITISGYIHCSSSYTSEQIKLIKDAFGEDAFLLSNLISFDCNSDQIIISATGEGVQVIDETTIEVLQGTEAQFSATGFPIIEAVTPTYEWIVFENDEPHHGSEQVPNIPFGDNVMNFKTGLMRTAETPAPDTTYRIYVQKSTGGDGIVNVIVKARTYPQNVNVELVHESSPTELIDGIINVSSTGHYIFDANHLPNDYNGTMKNTDGGVWIIDGISEEYVRSCADNYLEGRTPFDEFCMQVLRFPQDSEETEFLLKYESNWKGGQKITAPEVRLALMSIIYGVLSSNQLTGNPAMFYALEASGLAHADVYSYNSAELKRLIGEVDFNALLKSIGRDPISLEKITSGQYNTMRYLKNITGIDFTKTGVTGDLDFSNNTMLRKIITEGTQANVIVPEGSQFNTLKLGAPKKVVVAKNNNVIPSLQYASYVEEVSINEPQGGNALTLLNGILKQQEAEKNYEEIEIEQTPAEMGYDGIGAGTMQLPDLGVDVWTSEGNISVNPEGLVTIPDADYEVVKVKGMKTNTQSLEEYFALHPKHRALYEEWPDVANSFIDTGYNNYIQTLNNAYINTGVYGDLSSEIICKHQRIVEGNAPIYGNVNNVLNRQIHLLSTTDSNYARFGTINHVHNNNPYYDRVSMPLTTIQNKNGVVIIKEDGSREFTDYSETIDFTTITPLYLFSRSITGDFTATFFNGKIWFYKYSSNSVSQHLVPFVRNGEAGMIDLVSLQFFGNANSTGSFSIVTEESEGGADVKPKVFFKKFVINIDKVLEELLRRYPDLAPIVTEHPDLVPVLVEHPDYAPWIVEWPDIVNSLVDTGKRNRVYIPYDSEGYEIPYLPNSLSDVELRYKAVRCSSQWPTIFGTGTNSTTNCFLLCYENTSGGASFYCRGGNYSGAKSIPLNNTHSVRIISGNGFYIDNIKVWSTTTHQTDSTSGTCSFIAKNIEAYVDELTIREDNIVVQKYLPFMREGQACLLDIISLNCVFPIKEDGITIITEDKND